MIEIDPRQQKVEALQEEGRYPEALALLQERYAEAEAETAPNRARYFMTMFQWGLLMEQYPPASTAMAAARDEQVTRLLAGELYTGSAGSNGSIEETWERVSRYSLILEMNRRLGDPHATRTLFLQLEAAQPEQAPRYARQALPDIVEAGDFLLADRYRRAPLDLLGQVNDAARHVPLFPPAREAPRLGADLSNLAGEVRVGIAVLRGLGREEEAVALREALLAGLDSEPLRLLAARELDERGTINREIVAQQIAHEDREPQG